MSPINLAHLLHSPKTGEKGYALRELRTYMFKKMISMATATLLCAFGLAVLSGASANAADAGTTITVTQAPMAPSNGNALPVSQVAIRDNSITPQFTVGTITWSPSVTSFAANTVYSASFTLTTTNGYTFPNVSANGFVISGAGSTGVTVTSNAVTAGATTATVTLTFPDTGPATSGGGGVGGGAGGGSTCSSDLLSSSSTIKGVTFTKGTRQATSTAFNGGGSAFMGSVTLTSAEASGTGITTLSAGNSATVRWLYISPSINSWGDNDINTLANLQGVTLVNGRLFEIKVLGSGCTDYYRLRIIVSSVSTPTVTLTAEQIAANAAAAAKAAAQAAAEVRAAEISTAQSKLATTLKGDKAGTIDDYKAANISISTAASLARINAEVLKLSANDRSDFAKIKAIADKIEFDESFFNATARPTLATYAKYEVVGITDRTLAVVNTKVLELPVAKRADATAIQEIVKVESFVDLVANPTTREVVTSARLVEKGLLPAESPYKHSVRSALASYPEGSLNSMAKIDAAIKAEIEKAGARKAKTEEIKAKIAARRK